MTNGTQVAITAKDREAFYAAAVAGLRALDARERSPRRFGPDADTQWASFRGALTESDRIEFLLRDAAVTWGAAFSPAETFGLFGLAPDDPFGPDWEPLGSVVARRCLAATDHASDPAAVGKLLGVEATSITVPPLSTSTRLVVAGGGALIALAHAFSAQKELSWSDQVLAVATKPAHRQLAALLAVFSGSAARTRLTRPGDDQRGIVKAAGFAQLDVALVSADAEPECAQFARRAAGVA